MRSERLQSFAPPGASYQRPAGGVGGARSSAIPLSWSSGLSERERKAGGLAPGGERVHAVD
jgi:hypothetical protein